MVLVLYFSIILAATIVALCAYIKWVHTYWYRKGVPHIKPQFPLGNMGNIFSDFKPFPLEMKDVYFEMKRRNYKYGGIMTIVSPTFIPIDPDMVRSILTTKNFYAFSDRGVYHNAEKEPLEGNLFNISGTKWKELRMKLTPTFTSGKMKMMFSTLVECGQPLIKSMESYAKAAEPVDIKEVLGCFTTDVIGSCAFGLECNSFSRKESEFRKYGRKVFQVNAMKMAKLFMSFSFRNLSRMLGIVITDKDVSEFFMKAVKDTVEYRRKNKVTRNDFMQLLVNMWDSDGSGSGFTMEEIAAQAYVFFVAGFETSSTTMTFALYELAVNKDIQTRLREEINKVLDKHDGVVSYEGIHDMKYLNQVLDGRFDDLNDFVNYICINVVHCSKFFRV